MTATAISAQGIRTTRFVMALRLGYALWVGATLCALAPQVFRPSSHGWIMPAIFAILAGICAYGELVVGGRGARAEEKYLRRRILRRLYETGPSPDDAPDRDAHVVTLMTDNAERVTEYLQVYRGATQAALAIPVLTIAYIAIAIDPLIGLAMLVLVPFVPGCVLGFLRLFRGTSAHSRRQRAALMARYIDAIRHLVMIRLLGAGRRVEDELREAGERNRKAIMKLLAGNQIVIIVLDGVFSLILICAVAALAVWRHSSGAITMSQALTVALLTFLLIEPLQQVAGFFYIGMGGKAAQRAINRYLFSADSATLGRHARCGKNEHGGHDQGNGHSQHSARSAHRGRDQREEQSQERGEHSRSHAHSQYGERSENHEQTYRAERSQHSSQAPQSSQNSDKDQGRYVGKTQYDAQVEAEGHPQRAQTATRSDTPVQRTRSACSEAQNAESNPTCTKMQLPAALPERSGVRVSRACPNKAIIHLEDLCHDYGRGPVLRNLNLTVYPGDRIAVTGRSGSGKTTLLSLIAGVLPLQQGALNIAGYEAATTDLSRLRACSAVVSQRTWLFTGTIADNLRMACPQATEEQMWQALEKAYVAHDVRAMPAGLETDLGEGGALISGGQAQRLSLARAFLSQRRLILFDEPTSHVDMDSEQHILRAITQIGPEYTCIFITHRPSLLQLSNRQWHLADGHVTEEQR
ncbi:ATP-binding cassette domain-containing protein [Trueperella sp. LYQ143]|uniref:ATP-binding cassette domain-containing protein n=1 Tax=Trueperella sp. LYQ143 TaxID=3391059 RepID=UPI003983216F